MMTPPAVPAIAAIIQNKIQASLRRRRPGGASCRGGGETSWRGRGDLYRDRAEGGRGW
jgi:hypothetical protein